MKCSTAQKLINDHIDRLLGPEQVQLLESHLQRCTNCRGFFNDMESIVNNSRRIEAPELSGDLWKGIKQQVQESGKKDRIQKGTLFLNFPLQAKGMAFALCALLAVLVLIPMVYYISPDLTLEDRDPEKTALNHFTLAEQHYQSAIETLDRVIKTRDAELSPEIAAVLKKNLEIIDDSIRMCKAAIDRSPGNPEANRLLLICYRKKIELLKEIKDLQTEFS